MQNKIGDREVLLDLVRVKMPFGKYSGRVIADLPENYLVWFKAKGFPPGKLGGLMQTAYEIRLNGLDDMFAELKRIVKS